MFIGNLTKPFARISRARYFWLGLFIIVAVAAALLYRAGENYRIYFGMYHDDAIYMVCAKSLATGHGYRILSLPSEPLQTKYPIGFPLYLSMMWKAFPAFPDNLHPIVSLQAIFGALAAVVIVLYLLYFRRVTPLMALTVCGASLLNYRYIDLSPMVMSDFFCLVILMLSMWRTEVVSQKPFSWKQSILLALLILAPALVRLQAICGPAACLVHLLWNRRYKLAAVVAMVCAPVLAGEMWWQMSNAARAPTFLAFYTGYLPTNWSHLRPLRYLVSLKMSFEWGRYMQMGTYFPFVYTLEQTWSAKNATNAIILSLWHYALIWIGLLGMLREFRRRSTYGISIVIGMAPVLLFPVLVDWRQIVPGLGGFYYFFFLGWRTLGRWFKPRTRLLRRPYQLICAWLSLIVSIYFVFGAATESILRSHRYANHIGLDAPRMSAQADNSEYNEALYWINNNTAPADIFLCNNDPLLYLYTGHHAIPPWRTDVFGWLDTSDPKHLFVAAIQFAHPKYLMDDPMHRRAARGYGPAAELAAALIKLYPGSIERVFESSHHLIHIWKIHPEFLPQ